MAHKRNAVTFVKFSHDTKEIYSCGQDAKVSDFMLMVVHFIVTLLH